MSETRTAGHVPQGPDHDDESTMRTAAHGAVEQASALAGSGVDEAARVLQEVRTQSTRLMGDARSTARERAGVQFAHLATTLQDLSGELDEMSRTARPDGTLAALAHDGASAMRQMSRRIEEGGLDGTLHDVRAFARRRPLAFLGGAFAVGLLAGRVMRNTDMGAVGSGAREPDGRSDGGSPRAAWS
jgi:hypothetical protein